MKNIITASIEFYFKGKKFTPSLTIELDAHMQSSGRIPVLYPLIANQNNIDLYSYEYEIMQAETIKINHAEGPVANYVVNGILDIVAFELAWRDQHVLTKIQQLIEQYNITHVVQQHPEIEKILIEIYNLGKKSNTK